MAFISNNTLTKGFAYQTLKQIVGNLKQQTQRLSAQSSAGNVGARRLAEYASYLRDVKVDLAKYINTPGLDQYVKDEKNDQTYDLMAEYTALVAKIDAVIAWMVTNWPSADLIVLNADGSFNYRQFTPAQTTTLRAELGTLINGAE